MLASSLDKVLKFFILSASGSSLFFNNGTSKIVITLSDHSRFIKSFLKLVRFLIVLGDSKFSFGVGKY